MAFTLRLSDDQQFAWEAAAREQGRSLSNWIQRVCDEAANQRSGVLVGVADVVAVHGAHTSPAPRVRSTRVEMCEHRRLPGEFCSRCDG